jgi:D-alanyl-D-alanine carboxypeptidase
MSVVPAGALRGRVLSVLALCGLASAFLVTGMSDADAKSRKKPRRVPGVASGFLPPSYAAMVVDANTGRVLHADRENELRHPASVTKVMTLYMLFEQLEKGRFKLNDEIEISSHAASMAPSKLGLRPGDSITVEEAIKAIVTKSANDVAAAIGEAVGGSEARFAQMMTAKAHSIGMTRTVYANASGLPDPRQVTTARDLTILGRSIQERFPRYYPYFATSAFNFRGRVIGNHNRLLGNVEGVDGIKTGYTRASGFNLLSSAKRGNRRIVSVVLGGTSGPQRDRMMAGLIIKHIDGASPNKTTMVAEATAPADTRATAAPVLAPMAYAPATERARPAVIANAPDSTASIPSSADGSTRAAASASATPTTPRAAFASPPKPQKAETSVPQSPKVETSKTALPRGMMIQIGASDNPAKANELLAKARSRAANLQKAKPFTEKVQRGRETLYRARFAGLSESDAEAACKSLKRSGIACFATKN